eukprot:CAMPEP_0183743814 /NCGR_PEP_ID=MMETSP0737-20130205/65411_1 /TAXON_ID=385413 /ORGANISM="Thalassiosira miniscula, Strain CCMP1093" /LENGTH=285 /DNA_ID=CAMNT_0025979443 /DNA_START=1004 /DNA_END=1858 /DNA_ORIENTATION=+
MSEMDDFPFTGTAILGGRAFFDEDNDDKNMSEMDDFPFTGTAILGGRAFFDEDNDGLRDDFSLDASNSNSNSDVDFNGISNVEISLYQCNDRVPVELAKTTTSIGGLFKFDSLTSGNYYLMVSPPKGYEITNAWKDEDDEEDLAVYQQEGRLPQKELMHGELLFDGSGNYYLMVSPPKGYEITNAWKEEDDEDDRRRLGSLSTGREIATEGIDANNINERRRRRRFHDDLIRSLSTKRTLATGGIRNGFEKNTIDPNSYRIITCIPLQHGETTMDWGVGLYQPGG